MTVEELIKKLETVPAKDFVKVKLEYQRSVGDKVITRKADVKQFEINLTEAILIIR